MPTPASQRRKALAQLARQNRQNKRFEAIGAHPLVLIDANALNGNKFHAVKTVYRGHTYDSIGEAEFAAWLDRAFAAGAIASWEVPKRILLLDAPKARDRVYIEPDFYIVPLGNAFSFYVDYKGSRVTETPVFRLKVKLWKQTQAQPLWVVSPDAAGNWTWKVVAPGKCDQQMPAHPLDMPA